ncbi:uncharacterized protein LOC103280501 [Anolis carolinensis]|uniref:uncharacterized protein LOC103280501 n=1 Tax=Anolis carolinensis TaxID=28377 RepID=UPI002F2B214D
MAPVDISYQGHFPRHSVHCFRLRFQGFSCPITLGRGYKGGAQSWSFTHCCLAMKTSTGCIVLLALLAISALTPAVYGKGGLDPRIANAEDI